MGNTSQFFRAQLPKDGLAGVPHNVAHVCAALCDVQWLVVRDEPNWPHDSTVMVGPGGRGFSKEQVHLWWLAGLGIRPMGISQGDWQRMGPHQVGVWAMDGDRHRG